MNIIFSIAMGVVAGLLTNLVSGVVVATLVWMMLTALRETIRDY